MKLRKALVASVAAVAVSFAGTSVASAQETGSSLDSLNSVFASSSNATSGDNTDKDGNTDDKAEDGSSVDTANEISAWLKVIVAVVGVLTTVFSFLQSNK